MIIFLGRDWLVSQERCCSRCLGPVEGFLAALFTSPSLGWDRRDLRFLHSVAAERLLAFLTRGLVFRSGAKPFPGLITHKSSGPFSGMGISVTGEVGTLALPNPFPAILRPGNFSSSDYLCIRYF